MSANVVSIFFHQADMTCAAEPLLSAGGVGGSSSHHDIATETCSVGVTTDPDCLGPCEPGTSVILEGIVWSESNNGRDSLLID